jgi:hypothetical protein
MVLTSHHNIPTDFISSQQWVGVNIRQTEQYLLKKLPHFPAKEIHMVQGSEM